MKNLVSVLVVIVISGCTPTSDKNIISTDADHFSGVFITQDIPSIPILRIVGKPVAVIGRDSNYHVSGLLEEFTSYNAPIGTEHFSEALHYLGGDPNARKNWECIEIYVGNKKIK
jgi:hypothetical protein